MKLNLVPAGTGIQWVRTGIRTFLRQPLALSGLFFIYMAAAALLSALPVVGPILALAITPAATLGLMAASQEAARGNFPMPTVLVRAFQAGRQRLRAMLQLGLIYATASLLVLGIADLIAGPAPVGGAKPGEFDGALVLLLVLHLPLAIMFWFAPALVHWHGVTPVKSLFFSLVAVLRNIGAFMLYLLTWSAFIIVLAVIMGALASVFGSPQAAPVVVLPLAMIVAAMFFTSIYFTFVDCFRVDSPETATPAPENLP
jgi:hypothetical protein